jgi:hypothetical protein
MKLMTEISGNDDDVILVCNGDIDVSADDQMEHDAACAHALMQAVTEMGSRGTWARDRADEIMAGWGFDSTPEQPE